jgi:hypothetical protein
MDKQLVSLLARTQRLTRGHHSLLRRVISSIKIRDYIQQLSQSAGRLCTIVSTPVKGDEGLNALSSYQHSPFWCPVIGY